MRMRDQEQDQAFRLYVHVKEIAKIKYESELRREDSIIQQSSHMQTAFAFMTAALFAAASIVYQNMGILTFSFLLTAFSSITGCLLLSLVFASLAQRRRKTKVIPDIKTIEDFIDENWEHSITEAQQTKQIVQLLSQLQKSLSDNNDQRVIQIRASMTCFFISIGMIAFWFIIAIAVFN